jgi:hypothetical protein
MKKFTYSSDYLNFHIIQDMFGGFTDNLTKYEFGLIFGPTKNVVNPPMTREELKGLADFIYTILDNDKNQSN